MYSELRLSGPTALLCYAIEIGQSLGTLGMLPRVNLIGGTDRKILNAYCICS